MTQTSLSAFLWSVADLLRGDYKQSEYGKVILPFTVLRRLDCVLAPTKAAVLSEDQTRKAQGLNPAPFLRRASGQSFFNTSPLDMPKLMGDQDHIRENLFSYLQAFSPEVRDIFERFEFHAQLDRLAKANLLYLVTERFAQVDLHPDRITNSQMGLVFEELIRKFAEISNETAGEHFTPREVIRLMVNLLFIEDDDVLATPGVVRTIYDPTAGTGGMLSVAGEYLAEHNPKASLTMFGQELNPESYAICKADMLIKGQEVANIAFGNTFSEDGHPHRKFDYMLSNPPFGVEWKKVERQIRTEHETQGFSGRFGPGLPRVSDGSLLFLLHLLSKMRPAKDGGSRFGIVLNGSPLFTGGAGSGESEIRKYVLENDLLEAIIGLPTDMFYNTGIATYVWILSNRKPEHRKGKLQRIDASGYWQKMRKSLGSKRKELSEDHINEITKLFGDFKEEGTRDFSRVHPGSSTTSVPNHEADPASSSCLSPLQPDTSVPTASALPNREFDLAPQFCLSPPEAGSAPAPMVKGAHDTDVPTASAVPPDTAVSNRAREQAASARTITEPAPPAPASPRTKPISRIFNNTDFGYRTITLERPLRDAEGKLILGEKGKLKGKPQPDPSLRDTENVPLSEDIADYVKREVLPHAPDAWVDHEKTKTGYEIPFNRHFYVFEPPRELAAIDADLKACTDRIKAMIEGLSA